MPAPTDKPLGTRDLEKGMRPSRASDFRTIALNAVILLLLFNSEGLVQWAQRLPSSNVNVWLAGIAADWNELMQNLQTFGNELNAEKSDPGDVSLRAGEA